MRSAGSCGWDRAWRPAATLALHCMDGVFLSPNEDEFVGRITEELERFVLQGQLHSVLLFPPLSSRLRYLIHRTVDSMDLLSSFSVGEGWRRRTVICHSAVRLPTEASDQKPSTNPLRPARAPQPWGRGSRGGRLRHAGDVHGDNPRASVGSGRIRRPPRKKPDKALYVPKAMRKREEWGEQENPLTAGGDVAQEEETCPKETAQEELGRSEGSSGDVSLAFGEQEEPGEGNPPAEAEEQDLSCDNTVTPEGTEILCQVQAEDQSSRNAGVLEHAKTSSLTASNCGADPAEAESSTGTLVLESQDESHTTAKGLESSRIVSLPEEQRKDLNAGTVEGGKSSSNLESQDECPSVAQVEQTQCQNPTEAPDEPLPAAEPMCGAEPSSPEDQTECGTDAPVQNHSGKESMVEGEDKEASCLANALWHELHLPAGDREENVAMRRRSSLEDDCTTELLAEIVGYLTVKSISVEKISLDYSSYRDAQVSEGDFGHVTEIYDFSPSLKTEDLVEMFSDFHESGFKIQWVDDTHALGIFSSLSTASQALGRRYPALKIRPLIHATKQSKIKALQRPKLLHLAKERPQTDTAVAKRLVTRALGLKHKQQEGSGTDVLLPESLDQEE
ncbi:R3H and coiled-coil domain-containing protein 1 isoform X2 [Lathamus discolor]|uniref:R3H and coiled-coil domain-containing protein 1 isoform X2 n=1 Tax=Lathamus discolor TaxID=678569 RepID=UPI0032B72277